LLNVFLIGLIVGNYTAQPPHHGDHEHSGTVGGFVVRARVESLPAEEKDKFVGTMVAHRSELSAARHSLQAARHNVETELTSPSYDRDRVAAAFLAFRKANLDLQEKANAALLEAFAALSPRSRLAVIVPEDRGH
jgi:uncharacterized membrane protein